MQQITHHTDLLNALIEKYNLKSYLEIGVQNPSNNFDKIKCERKVGVDPALKGYADSDNSTIFQMFSDEFFMGNKETFDLTFIDGLHHADQVKRDFENSLRCLSDNGFIVIHDVLPWNEEGTAVPRATKMWWGDVYKWAMQIGTYKDIMYETFDIDNGCMLVWKRAGAYSVGLPNVECNWDNYILHKKELMNVTSTVEI